MSSHEKRDSRPVRTPAALWRVIDGCAVIFHEETGRAFALNETATRIWETCDGAVSLGGLMASLGNLPEEERAGARASLEHLLDELVREGFIRMIEAHVIEAPVMKEDTAGEERPLRAPAEAVAIVDPRGDWSPPIAEEIRFAACDCTGGGYGNIRNIECLLVSPGQAS